MSIQSILILCSVPFVVLLTVTRAHSRGINPSSIAHQVMPGLLIMAPILWYALTLSLVPAGAVELVQGGPLLHSGVGAVLLVTLVIAQRLGLRPLVWVDICVPAVLLGLAIVGVSFTLAQGPSTTLLLAIFWQLGTLGALLRTERLLRALLRPGDTLLLCGVTAVPAAIGGLILERQVFCTEAQAACGPGLWGAPLLIIIAGTVCALTLALRLPRRTGRAALPEGAGPTL